MKRLFSFIGAFTAAALPILTSYGLGPTPEQHDHGMMWLTLTVTALFFSLVLWFFSFGIGYAAFESLPEPRKLGRKIEIGALTLPIPVVVLFFYWQFSAGT
jgi:membrane protein DedA with SNARE-associated domain